MSISSYNCPYEASRGIIYIPRHCLTNLTLAEARLYVVYAYSYSQVILQYKDVHAVAKINERKSTPKTGRSTARADNTRLIFFGHSRERVLRT